MFQRHLDMKLNFIVFFLLRNDSCIYIKGNVDVVSAYFLIISYIYVIGCGVAMTADVDGYSQINIFTSRTWYKMIKIRCSICISKCTLCVLIRC
jgi:hypothetical protein